MRFTSDALEHGTDPDGQARRRRAAAVFREAAAPRREHTSIGASHLMPQAVRSTVALAVIIVVIAMAASSGRGGPIIAGLLLVVGLPAIIALLRGAAGRDD